MANLNVNIAKKLISYVRHGVDINEDIKQIYNNSLIFIGDEGQIFVPAMNTYVGIGNTAYTATIDRITSVEEQIRKLAETLSTDLVSKIYANYSSRELIESGSLSGQVTGSYVSDKQFDPRWALNNDVTIKGFNDYNPETGFARTPRDVHPYQVVDAEGTPITVTYSMYYHNGTALPNNGPAIENPTAIPTSGITVTPHWGEIERVENTVTHQVVEKRAGNYITIDDSLTWSYMTNAYSYALDFTKRFTANEVDRLYHNLLGDSTVTYIPSGVGYFITNVSEVFGSLSDGDKAEYAAKNHVVIANPANSTTFWAISQTAGTAYYATYTSTYTTVEGEQVITSQKEYHTLSIANIKDILEGTFSMATLGQYVQITSDYNDVGVNGQFPQLYTADVQYDSTYNMNIADGINTLKEVAYLLDLLSDGTLGQTTYMTWSQVLQYNGNEAPTVDPSTRTFTLTYLADPEDPTSEEITRVCHQIYSGSNPRADDTYAYWVNTGDAETLGIQIAYSIAGNKTEIDDLHKHAKLIEEGKTSVRSVKTTNSSFVDFKTLTGEGQWEDTDTNQGKSHYVDNLHPNHNAGLNNDSGYFKVGDVNFQVTLSTATTYATSYTVENAATSSNKYFLDEYGGEWWGCYTLADMNNLNTTYATYYTRSETADQNDSYEFTEVAANAVETNPKLQTVDYYWIPNAFDATNNPNGAANNSLQNRTFVKITKAELASAGSSQELAKDAAGVKITKENCEMFYYKVIDQTTGAVSYEPILYSSGTAAQAALASGNNILYFLQSYTDVAVHAYVGENALATTEWTGALIDARLGAMSDNLEDVLQQAKDYTDEQIDKLDNQYIYSDFATYWADYIDKHDDVANAAETETFETLTYVEPSTPGGEGSYEAGSVTFTYAQISAIDSYEYVFAYNKEYEKYISTRRTTVFGGEYNETTNPYRLSYVTNSQFVYDIIEENGIVNGATHELPTDTFEAKAEVWGDESNVKGVKHQYEDIVLTSGSRTDTLFEKLYKWAHANNPETYSDTQVFVKDTTLTSYYALSYDVADYASANPVWTDDLPSANYVGGTDQTTYIFENGAFIEKNNSSTQGVRDFTHYFTNTNDKYWRQWYQKGPKYVELNFDNSNADITNKNYIIVESEDGLYKLDRSSGNLIAVTKAADPTAATPVFSIDLGNLQYITHPTTKSTKYFSVETKHYTYKDNGFGENAVNVTAHITRIEDAAPDNTGFADAYDVQSWVENYFQWVDISATVTDTIVQHSDKYHKQVSLEEYLGLIANGTTATSYETAANSGIFVPQLYVRSIPEGETDPLFNTIDSSNLQVATFWKDDQTLFTGTAADETKGLNGEEMDEHGSHVPVESYYLYKQFNRTTADNQYKALDDNYYIRIEEAKTNPINLTLTTYK